jgi:hypothetical protein
MTALRLLLVAAFACVWISGCKTPSPVPPPNSAHLDWTEKDVVGLSLGLVDPVQAEWMRFARGGNVLMTVGEKHGAVCAPVFHWSIVSGRLRIVMHDRKLYDELTLISRNSSTITARRKSGKLVTYKIQ